MRWSKVKTARAKSSRGQKNDPQQTGDRESYAFCLTNQPFRRIRATDLHHTVDIVLGLAVDRFFDGLAALDDALAETPPGSLPGEIIFQGPIADALTHVGQLTMMRGMAGAPVRPESYARANVTAGRVGRDQDGRRSEFDGDASPPAGV